jgi:hypothetical protein
MAVNQSLRADIDVIRRERVTLDKVKHDMTNQVNKISRETEDQEKKLASKSKAVEKIKEKIIILKECNEDQRNTYMSKYDELQVDLFIDSFTIN